MKRVLCAFFALVLALSMMTCVAEGASGEFKDLSGITVPDYLSFDNVPGTKNSQDKGVVTEDVVTIEGDEYKVVTPDGVTLTFTATGSSFALTQDLLQQAELYLYVIKNPTEFVDYLIQNYTHLDIYDYQSDVDIYVHVFDTMMAVLYPDSARLSDAEADYLLNYMKDSPDYFEGATDVTCGWIGNNVWFLGDMRETHGLVHLCAFVGGKEIFACAVIKTDEQYDRMLELMENLVIEVA